MSTLNKHSRMNLNKHGQVRSNMNEHRQIDAFNLEHDRMRMIKNGTVRSCFITNPWMYQ